MKFIIIYFSILIALISCKQEYECCWYNEGEIQENVGFCTTNKLTKKNAEAQYKQVNDLEWKCEKQ